MNTVAIKAGMENIDKARVDEIVERISKDSAHYKKSKKDEEKHRIKCNQIKNQIKENLKFKIGHVTVT